MYESAITREHRTAFALLIDQSGSMVESVEYDGQTTTKAKAVAEVTNQIIAELIERARRHDGIRDYYDIAIIGYSNENVKSMLGDNPNRPFISIAELAARSVKIQSRIVERVTPAGASAPYKVDTPMWVEPLASGNTPMYGALCCIFDALRSWCAEPNNRDSFPPIVINITDGESTDCSTEDLKAISKRIRSLKTADGEIFMINIHIAATGTAGSTIFPTLKEVETISHRKTRELCQISSVMPEPFNELICELKGVPTGRDFVGMSHNTSIEELITILNIGTMSVKRG